MSETTDGLQEIIHMELGCSWDHVSPLYCLSFNAMNCPRAAAAVRAWLRERMPEKREAAWDCTYDDYNRAITDAKKALGLDEKEGKS